MERSSSTRLFSESSLSTTSSLNQAVKKENTIKSFSTLPEDMVRYILSFSNLEELCRFTLVSKNCHVLVCETNITKAILHYLCNSLSDSKVFNSVSWEKVTWKETHLIKKNQREHRTSLPKNEIEQFLLKYAPLMKLEVIKSIFYNTFTIFPCKLPEIKIESHENVIWLKKNIMDLNSLLTSQELDNDQNLLQSNLVRKWMTKTLFNNEGEIIDFEEGFKKHKGNYSPKEVIYNKFDAIQSALLGKLEQSSDWNNDPDVALASLIGVDSPKDNRSELFESLPILHTDKEAMRYMALNDEEIVWEKADPKLLDDRDLVLEILSYFEMLPYLRMADTSSLLYISKRLCDDREIVLKALGVALGVPGHDGYKKIGQKLNADKNFFREAILVNPDVFWGAHDDLRSDQDFICELLELLRNYGYREGDSWVDGLYISISEALLKDVDFTVAILKEFPGLINYIDPNFDKDFIQDRVDESNFEYT